MSDSEAAAIHAADEQGGELAAVAELRRLFPGIAEGENARMCARSIAGWTPLPLRPPAPKRAGRRAV